MVAVMSSAACTHPSSQTTTDASGGALPDASVSALPDANVSATCATLTSAPGRADAVAFAAAPREYAALLTIAMPDANGLLGRNHTWGQMVSARFQEGAGLGVRIAVATSQEQAASATLNAIEVGLATVDPATGELVFSPPPGISLPSVTPTDVASAAAFFLGDACLGLLAAGRAPDAWGLGARVDAQIPNVRLALTWLVQQRALLASGDADAPNRLLFDARAFAACGAFVADTSSRAIAHAFLAQSGALQRDDGVVLEHDGSDTNYQSFSVRNLYDTLTVEDISTCSENVPRLLAGAQWLTGRVRPDGSVDSSGNSRTCGGGESFLGEPKRVSIVGVFEALIATGAVTEQSNVVAAGTRAAAWYRASPSTNPCSCDTGPCGP